MLGLDLARYFTVLVTLNVVSLYWREIIQLKQLKLCQRAQCLLLLFLLIIYLIIEKVLHHNYLVSPWQKHTRWFLSQDIAVRRGLDKEGGVGLSSTGMIRHGRHGQGFTPFYEVC